MKNCLILPVVTPILFLAASAHAEVTLDGTLSHAGALPGPDYQIGADLGQQHGGNLFHSFQDFNLQSHESATFSGPDKVQNVISRVTGGNPSSIDGTLRSTIPNADMYFLNPYGIMFGPNAKLDVQGGFHASTADYLRLSDGGRFEARTPSNSLLTVAPVEAFGFIGNSPTKLSVEGSQLSTLEHQTLSLSGGGISITGGQLLAPGGRFNLASVAQTEEVNLLHLEAPSLEKQGAISISDNANLNVNGVGGGEIFIRGGQLLVEHSTLQANTLGEQNGSGITMRLTESISLHGKSAKISSHTFGTGSAGAITVTTPRLSINQGKLLSNSFSKGAAGNIQVDTLQTAIQEGGGISSDSFNEGPAGNLTILAKERVSIIDKRIFMERETADLVSQLSSTALERGPGGRIIVRTPQLILNGASISSQSHLLGDAGEIEIEANSIEIHNGGLISATTLSQSLGTGGNITLKVKESIQVDGFRMGFAISKTDVFKNMQSGIVAITFGSGAAGNLHLSAKELTVENNGGVATATASTGTAGNLTIEVDDLYLKTGGIITNSSGGLVGGKLFLGTGDSGTAKITAKNSIIATGQGYFNPSGILSNTLVSGQGGNIEIHTNVLQIANGAEISANSLGIGNAGRLHLQANTIRLINRGHITTSAKTTAGGNILLTSPNLLYLDNAEITTSVATGKGDGGNITIGNPQFVVMNHGKIIAQADAGHGGNIHIIAQQFLKTPDSLISASSRVGLDGQVIIDSPAEKISGSLLVLATTFTEVSGLLPRPCTELSFEEFIHRSSFLVNPIAGSPPRPDDLKPSSLLLTIPAPLNFTKATGYKENKAELTQRLAWLTGCHS